MPAPPTAGRSGVVARIAAWTIAHRRLTLLAWVALLIAVSAIANAVGTRQATSFSLPGTDAQRAIDVLKREFPAQAGDSDQIVFRARRGPITAPRFRARIEPMLRRVARSPHVSGVVSPFTPAGSGAVSRNGRIAFATVDFDLRANQLPRPDRAGDLARRGDRSAAAPSRAGRPGDRADRASTLRSPHAIGVLAAIVVLLIGFGSLVAMGMPILTALLASAPRRADRALARS